MSRIRANQITNQSADGAPTVQNGLVITGVTTSTSFSGDGSALTGLSGVSVANQADNRLITTTGTTDALNAESTLTYDGTFLLATSPNFVLKGIDTNASNCENYIQFNAGYITYDSDNSNATGNSGHYFNVDGSEKLRINASGQLIFNADTNTYIARPAADTFAFTTGGTERLRISSNGAVSINYAGTGDKSLHLGTTSSGDGIIIKATGDNYSNIDIDSNRSGANNGIFNLMGKWNGTDVATISFTTGTDTTNKDDGYIRMYTRESGQSLSEQLRITSNGCVNIGGDYTNSTYELSVTGDGSQQMKVVGQEADIWLESTGGSSTYWRILGSTGGSTHKFRIYDQTNTADRLNIDTNGFVTMPGQCSFRATKSGGGYNHSTGTFVWDQNQHNTGSNYNTSNGRFTAPVAGVYIFHAYSIYTGNSSNDTWDFQKNGSYFPGSRVHFTNTGVGGAWDNVTNTCIISLAANDYIQLRASGQEYHGGDWTAFCGSLLN